MPKVVNMELIVMGQWQIWAPTIIFACIIYRALLAGTVCYNVYRPLLACSVMTYRPLLAGYVQATIWPLY